MNYKKVYDDICENAKNRNLLGYSEKHHIIPRSLGGNNSEENLVDLTGREHFIAHKLLAKIYKGPMIYAFLMMCNTNVRENGFQRFKVSSRDYELARHLVSSKLSGTERTEDTKIKISISQKERMKNPVIRAKCSTRKGIPNSDNQKALISEKLKGIPKPKVEPCPHCDKICNKATAIRWHYDNCKMRK